MTTPALTFSVLTLFPELLRPFASEALLGKAFAGMDGAMQQAVQANQRALKQMVEQGASVQEAQVKKAIADVEKMEDALFAAWRGDPESNNVNCRAFAICRICMNSLRRFEGAVP